VLVLEPVVIGQVVGKGVDGYVEAIDLLLDHLAGK
jgi:3-dehydroquinate dehydratase